MIAAICMQRTSGDPDICTCINATINSNGKFYSRKNDFKKFFQMTISITTFHTHTHTPHSRPPTPTPIAMTSHEPCGLSIRLEISFFHYNIIIMSAMASHITRLTIIYSAFYSGEDQRKKSELRVTGLCAEKSPWPVNSPHKGPVTREMFPFDDVIMPTTCGLSSSWKSA